MIKIKITPKILINVAAVLLILLLSLMIVFLLCQPTESEPEDDRNVMEIYYDNKCESYGVQNANLAKGQIVFIGDSITDMYILDDHYADLPLASYNRGIGGDTTAGVLRRLKVSVFDIKPSVVVLMIGTNDINGGVSESDILSRYGQIIDEIYRELPDAKLYCMSIIPQNEDIETYSSIRISDTTPRILSANSKIRQLAESRGAIYLDLFPLLADAENHLIKEYSDDGLHLNPTGLAVWTELLKPYLRAD